MRYSFTPARSGLLRWLTDPGRGVSPELRGALLGELFSSPGAVVAGVLNGLLLNLVALYLQSGAVFGVFIAVDVILAVTRIAVVRRAVRAAARDQPTPTDLYLATALLWCALQGAIAFAAIRTGNLTLEILAATTVMGLVGPICARNYAAPRHALTLVALCDVPFVTGAALSGNPWLRVLVLQTPLFLFGVVMVIRRFHALAVQALRAEHNNHDRARTDFLTGLLNRFGLTEALEATHAAAACLTLFYFDLDGFKPINDAFGHQAGDVVLQQVAARLLASARPGDSVARPGGDEFAVVAAGLSPQAATEFARRIAREVAGPPFEFGSDVALRVGISVGFACLPADARDVGELHRLADAALYEAKAGRQILGENAAAGARWVASGTDPGRDGDRPAPGAAETGAAMAELLATTAAA